MIEAAGLGWSVMQSPVTYGDADGATRTADRFLVNYRSDTGGFLGIVSPVYKIIQNAQAFDWLDSLVDSGDAKYETAGALFGGKRIVVSMEVSSLPGIRVKGEKEEGEVRTYLVTINSHDGSLPETTIVTPVRWVCKNTLNLALGKHRGIYRVRHTGSLEGKLAAAREALGVSFEYMADFKRMADQLARQKIVDKQVAEIMDKLWPKTPLQLELGRENTADKAMDAYHASQTLEGIRGTKWGVLNAVAEFVDHELSVPKTSTKARVWDGADTRTQGILMGAQVSVKQRALELLK
jgi:phage/plasmid-like protein (TIGR03299 family)